MLHTLESTTKEPQIISCGKKVINKTRQDVFFRDNEDGTVTFVHENGSDILIEGNPIIVLIHPDKREPFVKIRIEGITKYFEYFNKEEGQYYSQSNLTPTHKEEKKESKNLIGGVTKKIAGVFLGKSS